MSIPGVGLPVIADGRLRNYVFVSLKLHIGGGKTVEQMRPKEAFFRAALVAAANAISGRGSVARAEIIAQNPRLRAGMTPGV